MTGQSGDSGNASVLELRGRVMRSDFFVASIWLIAPSFGARHFRR